MPPLCTAGYGLAHLDGGYFGALYLFVINAILIAASTTVVVRFLRFPLVKHVDPATERRYKRYFGLGLAALLLPSAFILYNTVTASVRSTSCRGLCPTPSSILGWRWSNARWFRRRIARGPRGVAGRNGTRGHRRPVASPIGAIHASRLHDHCQNDGPSGLEDLQRMVNLYAEGQRRCHCVTRSS